MVLSAEDSAERKKKQIEKINKISRWIGQVLPDRKKIAIIKTKQNGTYIDNL